MTLTTREIAARLRQLLKETQDSARTMVQAHGPPAELDQRADRAQMLLLRPPLEMLAERLEQQADKEERTLAENLAYLERMKQETDTLLSAPPPATEPQDALADLLVGAQEMQPALVEMRALLREVGLDVRIELGPVDPCWITVRLSGPLALHAAVRELLAEAGPLSGVLRTQASN